MCNQFRILFVVVRRGIWFTVYIDVDIQVEICRVFRYRIRTFIWIYILGYVWKLVYVKVGVGVGVLYCFYRVRKQWVENVRVFIQFWGLGYRRSIFYFNKGLVCFVAWGLLFVLGGCLSRFWGCRLRMFSQVLRLFRFFFIVGLYDDERKCFQELRRLKFLSQF